LQSEFVAAGPSRTRRLRALAGGYAAFWTVLLIAPFMHGASPARDEDALPRSLARHFTTGVTALTLLVFAGALFEISAVIVILAGAACAVAIHVWYDRHPLNTATPSDLPWRTPQINFSNMDIAGNIGGLIFVIGSLLVVVLGVPFVLTIL